MLSEGIASRRGRYGAYLHHDRINRKLRARRGARLAAITSGGAIPDTALFTVVAEPEGVVVGTVDEDFAVESMAGDIMLLGNTSWRIRRVEGIGTRAGRRCPRRAAQRSLLARRSSGAHRGALAACGRIAQRDQRTVAAARPSKDLSAPVVAEAVGWLREECGLDDSRRRATNSVHSRGPRRAGRCPTQTTIIAERFFRRRRRNAVDHPRALWWPHQ